MKSRLKIYYLLYILFFVSCNKPLHYRAILLNSNNFANRIDIRENGIKIGEAEKRNNLLELTLEKSNKISKCDSLILRESPLGNQYIDLSKCDRASATYYSFNDTIPLMFKKNISFPDKEKLVTIIRKLDSTFSEIDTILKNHK